MTTGTHNVRAKSRARTHAWLQGLAGLTGFALVLEIVPRTGLVSPHYLPPFSDISLALFKEAMTATFWIALGATLQAWAIGLAISLIAGVVIGIVVGSSHLLRTLTSLDYRVFEANSVRRADSACRSAIRLAD